MELGLRPPARSYFQHKGETGEGKPPVRGSPGPQPPGTRHWERTERTTQKVLGEPASSFCSGPDRMFTEGAGRAAEGLRWRTGRGGSRQIRKGGEVFKETAGGWGTGRTLRVPSPQAIPRGLYFVTWEKKELCAWREEGLVGCRTRCPGQGWGHLTLPQSQRLPVTEGEDPRRQQGRGRLGAGF